MAAKNKYSLYLILGMVIYNPLFAMEGQGGNNHHDNNKGHEKNLSDSGFFLLGNEEEEKKEEQKKEGDNIQENNENAQDFLSAINQPTEIVVKKIFEEEVKKKNKNKKNDNVNNQNNDIGSNFINIQNNMGSNFINIQNDMDFGFANNFPPINSFQGQNNLNMNELNVPLRLQNQNINIVINNKNKPLSRYTKPPLIGLDNIGSTCFMNSTLQCLSQTEGLSNYFLNPKNKTKIINNNIAMKNNEEDQLSPLFMELIQNLWNDKSLKRSYSPYKIVNKINKMNPLFKKGQAGDSKDFIIFLLEQFHKELKESVNKNNQSIKVPLNQYDKSNAFNHFFSEFKNECSVITDIFFGFIETTNECLNCKNFYNNKGLMNPICFNYQIFNCIIFPLEEVKNMKNNLMKNYNMMAFNNNIVSIYECFYYNQKPDFFTGENRNYCNICNQLYDSIYSNKIFVAPNVLVLILNRGKDNIYNVKLDFSETIDITEFVLQKDTPRIIYNLYGVITHIGKSGPSAHFVASCKSPIDNNWYRYNDSLVNPITNLQKEVIYFGTPYILFYQRAK